MRGHKNRAASGDETSKPILKHRHARRVNALERLVAEENLGAVNDRRRKRDLLSHPRAEFGQALAVGRGQVERIQQLLDALSDDFLVEMAHSPAEGQKLVSVEMVEEPQSFWHHSYAPFQFD